LIDSYKSLYSDSGPSTSTGFKGSKHVQRNSGMAQVMQSQLLGSSDVSKEIIESTQAIMFDDFESNLRCGSHNSTFMKRQDAQKKNIVLVSGN
jgi:hypothetical protein